MSGDALRQIIQLIGFRITMEITSREMSDGRQGCNNNKTGGVIKIHEVQQNSLDWLIARAGIPTASDFDNLITPGFKPRPWSTEMPNTYLAQKVAEAWIGGPLPSFQTAQMDIGSILEDEAIPFLEFEFSETIQRVGFITRDDDKVGCSPDGLIGDDGGIEIKCPQPAAHTKYLLAGELPEQYGPQVYGSMFVTGRPWWKFVSYCRGFPALVKTIERDETKMVVLETAVAEFLERFEAAMKRIEEMAGKPRPVKRFGLPPEPKTETEPENIDLTP